MRIYMTRHGQILPEEYYDGDTLFPAGDQPLSALGMEQSQLLGEYLRKEGFCGTIFASPYERTLQTAQIVAGYIESEIRPTPFLREIFKTQEAAESFCGRNMEDIMSLYDRVCRGTVLPYPWWEPQQEDYEKDVRPRVFAGLETLSAVPEAEILLVGHGATINAAIDYFRIRRGTDDPPWNCGLSMHDTGTGGDFYNRTVFLPVGKISSNITMMAGGTGE